MEWFEVILIAIGLAMDAFAVSVCKGLCMKKIDYKKALIIALYFGMFQGVMPVIGFFLGISFQDLILSIDHWIAFGLLSLIGGKMIAESFEEDENSINDKVDVKTMLILALATSIDALTVGITIAFLHVDILFSGAIIASITFLLCLLGVKIGSKFGSRLGLRAELIGGIILILIGSKILLNHLGIL